MSHPVANRRSSQGENTYSVSSSVPDIEGGLEHKVLALRLPPIFLQLFEALEEQSMLEASVSFLNLCLRLGSLGSRV